MNICILGCGSIGGLLAAHLARSDNQITVFDQGEHYDAIKNNGLVLQNSNGKLTTINNLIATNNLIDCARQDFIFLAVKAYQIQSICKDISNLLHENTVLVTLQNGIPWWFFQNYNGKFNNHILKTLDPDCLIHRSIPNKHIIGCVSYPAAEVTSPGIVHHIEGVRFPIGELDGTISNRAQIISSTLTNAGFKSPILEDIRSEIWLKAWGTLAFNPISVLTKATMSQICKYKETRAIVISLMKEFQHVANQLGIHLRVPLEQRLQGAENVGDHKTSMLQDFEAKRTLELEAILGAIIELAEMINAEVPHLKSLYAMTKLSDLVNRTENC
jgi:2-dehydropantoate 2-reductase